MGAWNLAKRHLHSWKLTWKPKRGPIKTTVSLKWGYMGFHVSLGECKELRGGDSGSFGLLVGF